MKSQFRHVALFGKYAAPGTPVANASSRQVLEDIAQFLTGQGCQVVVDTDTVANTGLTGYPVLDVGAIGRQCDLGLVVGGDGTMLGKRIDNRSRRFLRTSRRSCKDGITRTLAAS